LIHFPGKDARRGNRGDDMLLHQQISESLAVLKGLAADVPKTVGWAIDRGATVEDATVEIEFTAVDSLGCAFRELRLSAEELKIVPFETLKTWADDLCKKVTYLLEQLVPLERDAEGETVLIRSVPPTRQPDQSAFYEILVKAPGTLNLRRYTFAANEPDRQACDIQITQQALVKLVGDIVAAIPAAATA
jgi:hypothetical protein